MNWEHLDNVFTEPRAKDVPEHEILVLVAYAQKPLINAYAHS